jgi:hypothetical protein
MTKSVSTQQAKQVLDNTHYLQVSATPVTIFDIEGECSSTTGSAYYIQVLGTGSPSSGTTIPLYSELCVSASSPTQNNGFSFTYRPIGIDTSTTTNPAGGTLATTGANSLPVYMAISSTDNVYTAVAASTQVTVRYEETYQELVNQTITGDLTTGVDSLIVWATPNAAKRLTQVVVSNSAATAIAPMYLMLFAYATPAAGATPSQEWTISDTAFHTLKFGNGIEFQQGNPTTYVQAYGCYLYGSSTPQFYTATTGTAWTMQAFNI